MNSVIYFLASSIWILACCGASLPVWEECKKIHNFWPSSQKYLPLLRLFTISLIITGSLLLLCYLILLQLVLAAWQPSQAVWPWLIVIPPFFPIVAVPTAYYISYRIYKIQPLCITEEALYQAGFPTYLRALAAEPDGNSENSLLYEWQLSTAEKLQTKIESYSPHQRLTYLFGKSGIGKSQISYSLSWHLMQKGWAISYISCSEKDPKETTATFILEALIRLKAKYTPFPEKSLLSFSEIAKSLLVASTADKGGISARVVQWILSRAPDLGSSRSLLIVDDLDRVSSHEAIQILRILERVTCYGTSVDPDAQFKILACVDSEGLLGDVKDSVDAPLIDLYLTRPRGAAEVESLTHPGLFDSVRFQVAIRKLNKILDLDLIYSEDWFIEDVKHAAEYGGSFPESRDLARAIHRVCHVFTVVPLDVEAQLFRLLSTDPYRGNQDSISKLTQPLETWFYRQVSKPGMSGRSVSDYSLARKMLAAYLDKSVKFNISTV